MKRIAEDVLDLLQENVREEILDRDAPASKNSHESLCKKEGIKLFQHAILFFCCLGIGTKSNVVDNIYTSLFIYTIIRVKKLYYFLTFMLLFSLSAISIKTVFWTNNPLVLTRALESSSLSGKCHVFYSQSSIFLRCQFAVKEGKFQRIALVNVNFLYSYFFI